MEKHNANSVMKDIELKIIADIYPSGSRLPTLAKISQIYGVSVSTAQRMLDALCEDGVTLNRHGVGYFVKPFVKKKLYDKHKALLTELLKDSILYSQKLGLTREEFDKILNGLF